MEAPPSSDAQDEAPAAHAVLHEAHAYEPHAPEGARGWFVQAESGQVLADFYGPQAGWMARAFAELMNRPGTDPPSSLR